MTEYPNYEYSLFENKPFIACIKLGKQVLGGNDALHFTSKLEELCKLEIKYTIIDMQAVEVINSSGLGMLISGMTTLRKFNIQLILAAIPNKVNNLLKMTHLDEVFKIFDTVDDAVEKCK